VKNHVRNDRHHTTAGEKTKQRNKFKKQLELFVKIIYFVFWEADY